MNDFRKKMNDCSAKMKDISLLRGQSNEVDADARNRNTFFDSFNKFTSLMCSFYLTKNFPEFKISDELHNNLKYCWNSINEIFKTEKVNNPVTFRNMVNKSCEDTEKEWKDFVSSLDVEVLDMLEIFSQVCNNKREILDIINGIKSLNTWPLNENIILKYTNRKKQGEKKISDIHFDSEIEDFLRKVKDKRANLLDLTPTILEWIKDNDLGKNISLGIKMF